MKSSLLPALGFRASVGGLAIFAVCWSFTRPVQAHPQTAGDAIEVWLVTDDPDGFVAQGARFGAEEAQRTASLLGRKFVLQELPIDAMERLRQRPAAGRQSRHAFLILDVDGASACDVARAAGAGSFTIVNTRVVTETCAVEWLQVRRPATEREELLRRAASPSGRIDEWHHTLFRFGAGELNERFERQTRRRMDADAWAGWFAVKAATEAALRLERPGYDAMVASSAPAFDGHKGVPLRFAASGVLQQPMYVIEEAAGRTPAIREVK